MINEELKVHVKPFSDLSIMERIFTFLHIVIDLSEMFKFKKFN